MSNLNGNRPKADIARKKKLARRKRTKLLRQELAQAAGETKTEKK